MEPFVRQELLCWDMKTGDLVKRMVAHFQVPLSQKVNLSLSPPHLFPEDCGDQVVGGRHRQLCRHVFDRPEHQDLGSRPHLREGAPYRQAQLDDRLHKVYMIYHLIFRDVNVQYLNVCWHCCRCDEELYRRLGFHDRTGLQTKNSESRTPRVQMYY